MKKNIILTAIVLVASLKSEAQISNYSFENWTNMGSYENPDSWGTLNNTTTMAGVYTVTKATPGNPGSYYMKITSKTIGTGVVGGIAVSGQLDSMTMLPKTGFPFTQKPISFTGKWQHMIYGSSQGSLSVILTRWNTSTNNRDTIATANQTLSGMAMSWANFSLNFTYFDTNSPDTCVIILKSSGSNPTNNDYLWVDNLAFSGNVSVAENDIRNSILIGPNPVKGSVIITSDDQKTVFSHMSIYDLSGKIVADMNLNNVPAAEIDLHEVNNGTYFLQMETNYGLVVKKIIKE